MIKPPIFSRHWFCLLLEPHLLKAQLSASECRLPTHERPLLFKWIDSFIILLIFANSFLVLLEELITWSFPWLWWLEVISFGVFGTEYLLRLWSCSALPAYQGWWGKLRFMLRPAMLLDALVLSIFYLSVALPATQDTRQIRLMQLLRMLRFLMLTRYNKGIQVTVQAIYIRRAELSVAFFLQLLLIKISAGLIYFLEHTAQPTVFSSITASLWWAVTTMTTVGYGDMSPITPLGRLVGGVVQILGVMLFALLTGIFGAAFWEEFEKERK